MQIGLCAHSLFVDHQALFEPVEPVGRGRRMRRIAAEQMCKAKARCWCRLEAAIAPTSVKIEPIDMCPINDDDDIKTSRLTVLPNDDR